MAVKAIQLGQVWRNDQTGETFLVTKLYDEVFSQYAMLRRADSTAASAGTAGNQQRAKVFGFQFYYDLRSR